MITRVRGTQDFLDCSLFNTVVDRLAAHAALYNFHPVATPILEPLDLFQRGLGQHTDVVNKEMFVINTGPDGESICLRPEATAGIIRAVVEAGVQNFPLKVYTHGPMFRYERPQKGRYRQFHQFSLELIGSASVAQDVQLISMLDRFFTESLKLNNYVLLLNFLGCDADAAPYRATLRAFLDKHDAALCATCRERKEKNIMRVFDCKQATCQELYKNAPFTADHLCASCATEYQSVQDQLSMLSVSFVLKPTLVRGLDYYGKTVFEFVSANLGAQNTFCAGGRYDKLVTYLGGKEDLPSVGAAVGIERVMLLLEPVVDALMIPALPPLYLVMPFAKEQEAGALLLADELRRHGLCVDVLLDGGSIKSMMRRANKMGAAACLLLGQDEQAAHQVTLKDMISGTEERIAQTAVAGRLKK